MRALTAKQKKLLKIEYDRLVRSGVEYPDYDDVPYEVADAIDSLNYCEIFVPNVDRFFNDLTDKRLEKKEKDDWF